MLKKTSTYTFFFLLLISSNLPLNAATETTSTITHDAALAKLSEGNERFIDGKMIHPHQNAARRKELTQGQQPFAVVVGCSDSRVPPEIIFDQGAGDIFIVRLAGNIVDDAALGSIEYAVKHLGASLIVVLGHEKCGAVDAAIQGYDEPNYIQTLVKAIEPAVEIARKEKGDLLENAIKENIFLVERKLESSGSVLPERIRDGKLHVTGAYYHLDSGEAEFL